MKRKIEIKESATRQLEETFLWYEQQRENLGIKLLDEWENTLEYISEHAESCQKKYKEFRLAMLKRFPYIIVYEIEGTSVIIYSLISTKRHPSKRFKKSP